MPQCAIFGNITLTSDNVCKSHIIPNALGGRLTLSDFLSTSGDNYLRGLVEQPLIDALAPMMTLLGAPRQRGHNQPITVAGAKSGKKYVFAFNEPIGLARHEYSTTESKDGSIHLEIRARTKKEARDLIARARKQFPELATAEIDLPEFSSFSPSEMMKISFEIGESVTFPGAYNILSLFMFQRLGRPPEPWRQFIEDFCWDRATLPPRSFFVAHSPPWLSVPKKDAERVCHTLVIKSIADRKALFGYVELFGVVRVGTILGTTGFSATDESYRFDVTSGREIERPSIDEGLLSQATFQSPPREQLWASARETMSPLVRVALQRQHDAKRESDIDGALNRALGPINPNQKLQPEDLKRLVAELMETVVKPRLK